MFYGHNAWQYSGGILRPAEIRRWLRAHAGWRLEHETLVRELSFSDFSEALRFAGRLAVEAEDYLRHPDVLVHDEHQVRVLVSNRNHAGLTTAELRLAEKVDAAVERFATAPTAVSDTPAAVAGAHIDSFPLAA